MPIPNSRPSRPSCVRVDRRMSETARYCAVLLAGIAIFLAEFIGGICSKSLALMSDSGHVFADNVSVVISIAVAEGVRRTGSRASKERWRWHGAKLNALLLAIPGLLIVHEAFARMVSGLELKTWPMIGIAAIGGAGNWFQHLQLHKAEDKSHSTHQLLHLHVVSDLLQSAAVCGGGIAISVTGWVWLDPALSLAIGTIMLWWGLRFLLMPPAAAPSACACANDGLLPRS